MCVQCRPDVTPVEDKGVLLHEQVALHLATFVEKDAELGFRV
jgi:hypothetical protein